MTSSDPAAALPLDAAPADPALPAPAALIHAPQPPPGPPPLAATAAPAAPLPAPVAAPVGAENLWLVAVGASAGGLEALQRFFGALQSPTGAAFVVIQHLAPDHRSMMPELLARHCALPVTEAGPGQHLAPDQVYLMPPGVLMTLAEDALQLRPRPMHGVSLPIDHFLHSLATVMPERGIGVVLSGSGSDGASGAAALRAAGGYVMAQSAESAKFDSMPRSLMAATVPDAVATPELLAAQVLRLTRGQAGRMPGGQLISATAAKPALQRLFERLTTHAGIDFSQYKLPTVMRRIERRMTLTACANLGDYADRVEGSADECELLRQELLIPVTGFFRDPEAFASLGSALRGLVRQHQGPQPLRIWSAGCATGEEAYSLAIAALEACEAEQRWPGIKVFATDVDARFLAVASSGHYPLAATNALGAERTQRHLVVHDGRLSVRPELRQMVLFARHNLLEDAPFTKMDLVTCRNTLIYLQAEPQDRVMRRLQYALNPGGLLFLGSSESLGVLHGDFQVLDATHKLFRLLRPLMTSLAVRDGFSSNTGHRNTGPLRPLDATTPRAGHAGSPGNGADLAARALLQAYAPATLLVDAQRHLLHAWGPSERYLRVPPGQANLDVMRMLPPRLAAVAGALLQQALHDGQMHAATPLRLQLGEHWVQLRAVARPLAGVEGSGKPRLVLLSFEPQGETAESLAQPPLSGPQLDRLAELERELADTRLTLQSKIEELEAANEELQATNEELMSANEELQSTNEELQSLNEELHTVNAEYNAKLELVSALHADLDGMSQATGIATIFVDRNQALVRFTPEATLLFRLRPTDIGRPVSDFKCQLDYPELMADLAAALRQPHPLERELVGPGGARYLARVVGYGEQQGAGRRVVLSLIDVTRLHEAERLQGLIDALPEHVALLDRQGNIVQVNHAWEDFARCNVEPGQAADTGIGANYLRVLGRADDVDAVAVLQGLRGVLNGELPEFRRLYPCHSPTEKRWFVLHAAPLHPNVIAAPAPDGPVIPPRVTGAVVAHLNVTPWLRSTAPELADE